MRKLFLLLAVLLSASTLHAQIIPPTQNITVVSSGITVCTTGNCATWNLPNSAGAATFEITGTATSLTLTFEGTANGNTWFTIAVVNVATGLVVTTTTTTGQFAVSNPGLVGVRARCTTYMSGAVNVTLTRGPNNPIVAPI